MKKNIIKQVGKKRGKTLTILAGVHGNEKAGVMAINKIINNIQHSVINIREGTVYFIYANPKAIEKNLRYIDKNLNRCFIKNLKGNNYEILRAKEIMKILDKSDAVLDLHASNNPKATPFIICEKNAYNLAKNFNFKILSSGWDTVEPGGTDGYMYKQGKIGICLECGSLVESEKNKNLAYNSILQFLSYFNIIKKISGKISNPKKYVQVKNLVYKKTKDFAFVKEFADFEILKKNSLFATDGNIKYIAKNNECIIFPHADTDIGDEAFILGEFK